MGMAASQARLLTITARMHDVEYKAQSIQNAKLLLATQSDEAYQEYLDALDASTLTIKGYDNQPVTANFKNLTGIDAVDTGNKYALKDSNGRLIVSDDIYEAYHDYLDNGGASDPYLFAMYMLDQGAFGNPEELAGNLKSIEDEAASKTSNLGKMPEILTKLLAETGEKLGSTFANKEALMSYLSTCKEDESEYKIAKEALDKYEGTEASYRYQLYQQNAQSIFVAAGGDEIDYSDKEFKYYANIFSQIQAAGDCVSISDYNGPDGDASTDSDWLKNMIQCGKITIDIVNTDKKNGEVTFTGTSPSSDTFVSYTTTTTIDKTALAKAEAEYEHKTKEIDRKDKKFDLDLSKLETERTALTTEYDSVKKVISDNIERTFGIFS